MTREQKTTLNYLKKAGATKAELDTLSILLKADTSPAKIQKKIDLIIRRSLSRLSLEQKAVYYSLREEERLEYLAAPDKERWIKKREDRSVKKLCSTREGKTQYYALKNLLSKEDLKDFVKKDSTERVEWLKSFWAKSDPTPTTERNEWEEEFNRRVRHALENFHSTFGQKPWDDRGDVYIKLGPPDERRLSVENPSKFRIERIGDSVYDTEREYYKTAGETWYYVIEGKDVYLQFEDLVVGYLTLVPYRSGDIRDLDYMSNFLAQNGELGLSKAVYHHDYGGEPLDFAWEIIKFRSLNNVYEVLVNVGIPTGKLEKDSSGLVHYNQQIAIRDEKGKFIYCDSVRVCQRVPDFKNQLLIDQRGFLLTPGTYSVALEVRDPGSKRIGLYEDELFLPGYVSPDSLHQPNLELSRAILASEAKEAQPDEEESKFFLNGYLIIPNPSHIFLVEQEPKIKAYFEIYNLLPKDDSLRFATISQIIKYVSKDSAVVSSDTTVTIHPGFVPGTVAYQIIPLINSPGLYLEPGDYLWRIDVIDLNLPNKIESIVNKLKIVKD
ncbi:MAG: GWxTD domain-containing protein [candidate division Zixibacteria bacterium]|nr:GWxTD domain-containing protein [candidate division Zixibacteria bacterium]